MNKTMQFLMVMVFMVWTGLAVNGGVVFQCDFQPEQLNGWTLPDFAKAEKDGGQSVLNVTVSPGNANQMNCTSHDIDLTPYRGQVMIFSCKVKADNVSKPQHRWNGIKFMFNCRSGGRDVWNSPQDLFGSFDWKEISVTVKIPDDATKGKLMLGLQESSGTVKFTDVKASCIKAAEIYPPIMAPPNFKAEYSDRVKNMPPLRGVMSPPVYRLADFEDLAKWNANVIRWQLVRAWGKAGTDRDKTEYSQWIDSKIAELDKLLADAQRLSLKVIIDLHSPPGGRYADRDMAMFYEPEYAAQFIEVWQRIAKHFKGNSAVWAYDLINEPVQTRPAKSDYLTLQHQTAQAIRAIDPEIPIIVESNMWSSAATYTYLCPLPLKNIIYQLHMYTPGSFTHQNVGNNWGETSVGVKPVVYPGLIEGENYNREMLRKHLQPVIDFQKKYGVRVYAGEFSAIRWAPGAAQYLEDCIAIFEENKWDWSYHAFREWSGWSVEHSNDPLDKNITTTDSDRKKVLLKYYRLNKQ